MSLRSIVRRIGRRLGRTRQSLGRWLARFGNSRECLVCKRRSGRFLRYGTPARDEAECAWCGALERHRLVWGFFEERTDLFDGRPKRMLHVAAEPALEARLRERIGEGYLTADLDRPGSMVCMDITAIDFPDDTFDVIYCSHVLEHVIEDRKAIREFLRVLRPAGWAVLCVPIRAAVTYEDPSITDPAERFQAFGQHDHVRIYGRDFVDRLREAGFEVEVCDPVVERRSDELVRLGMAANAGEVYYCTRGNQGPGNH